MMPWNLFKLPSYALVKETESSSVGAERLCLRPMEVNLRPRSSHMSASVATRSFCLGCVALSWARRDSRVAASVGFARK